MEQLKPCGCMASSSSFVLREYSSCFRIMDYDVVTMDSCCMLKILLFGLLVFELGGMPATRIESSLG